MTEQPEPGPQQAKLITVAAAAEQLSASTDYVRAQMERGALPFVKLPTKRRHGKFRIRQVDLDRFILANQTTTPED